jgi:hypothetical protein
MSRTNFRERQGAIFALRRGGIGQAQFLNLELFTAKRLDFLQNQGVFWSWMRDSNSRPHDYESGALPTELIQHLQIQAYVL